MRSCSIAIVLVLIECTCNISANISGILVPVFTPFNQVKRTFNLDAMNKRGQYLKSKGIQGVLVNGIIGEGITLRVDERKRLAEEWLKVSRKYGLKMVLVIDGIDILDVYALGEHAEQIGVDGVVLLPDLFYRPRTEEDLVEYFKSLFEYITRTQNSAILNGTINVDAIDKSGQYLKLKGIQGVLVDGEGAKLSVDLHKQLAEEWLKVSRKYGLTMVLTVGGIDLPEIYELAEHAEKLKVDAVLLMSDLFYRPRTEMDLIGYTKLITKYITSLPLRLLHFLG